MACGIILTLNGSCFVLAVVCEYQSNDCSRAKPYKLSNAVYHHEMVHSTFWGGTYRSGIPDCRFFAVLAATFMLKDILTQDPRGRRRFRIRYSSCAYSGRSGILQLPRLCRFYRRTVRTSYEREQVKGWA